MSNNNSEKIKVKGSSDEELIKETEETIREAKKIFFLF